MRERVTTLPDKREERESERIKITTRFYENVFVFKYSNTVP